MSHSILPPSSAAIWGAPEGCRGWVSMQRREGLPHDSDSEASKEGTLAHAEAERILTGTSDPVTGDADMLAAVRVYTDNVAEVLGKGLPYLYIESRVEITVIHENCYGTPDGFAYVPNLRTLYVWDYKHGRKPVDAFENWQCIAYAAGIIDMMSLNDQETTVVIIIVQPNAYDPEGPVKAWTVPAWELRPYVNHLARGARESLEENPETRSGPHCRYCRARTVCTSAITAGAALYESVDSVPRIDPSIESLSLLYAITKRAKAHIDAMFEGYKAQIEHKIAAGEMVPGYSLTPKFGNRRWKADLDYVESFMRLLGVDATEKKLKSPARVEKEIKGGLIDHLVERAPAGHKITEDNLQQVRRIFK